MRSTFEIPEEMRQKIQEIVNDQTGIDVKMQYEIAPELICGVEMDFSRHENRLEHRQLSEYSASGSVGSAGRKAMPDSPGRGCCKNGNGRK